MANKQKQPFIAYLKETKVSLLTGTLVLFTQSIIILDLIPSFEVQHESVLRANLQALLSMIFG